jgi:hypothetical protein
MHVTVDRQDPRFDALSRGHNGRWPAAGADAAGRIILCDTAADVQEALQQTVAAGLRPTVRCGGHCYEDFVSNNPGGAIIDLSMLNGTHSLSSESPYKINAGATLGVAYAELYKKAGVTLPGGSCISVAAGGHITGGGYGVLSRLHGLTVDWLTAVDILTVDAHGKVIPRHVDRDHEPDLFRACRGGGGNNFGIVTAFYFDKLPTAPREVMTAGLNFPWADMTPERFEAILTTYSHYFETRGKDPDTWGLFTGLGLTHRGTGGGGIGISAQFCTPDGGCDDLRVLNEFLDLFTPCEPVQGNPAIPAGPAGAATPQHHHIDPKFCSGPHQMQRHRWYDVTIPGGMSGTGRGKYKSCYMKRGFTPAESACIYKHLTRDVPGLDLHASYLAVDSYGGATNRPEMAAVTSIPQRASVLKLQWQSYWQQEADDAGRTQWLREFYSDLYSGVDADPLHKETPYPNDRYEGCYINYPDKDMLDYAFWPQLYYGDQGLYPFLQSVKRRYDPNNIFHHAMSVRV